MWSDPGKITIDGDIQFYRLLIGCRIQSIQFTAILKDEHTVAGTEVFTVVLLKVSALGEITIGGVVSPDVGSMITVG